MPRADAALKGVLDRAATQLLERLPRRDTWTARVREILAAELARGAPTLEQIAYRLGVTERTLRRRLHDEGTSHKEVLAELRLSLAQRHLSERVLSVAEIAFLLGFAEPSAFHKAFRRWTGRAPADCRRA